MANAAGRKKVADAMRPTLVDLNAADHSPAVGHGSGNVPNHRRFETREDAGPRRPRWGRLGKLFSMAMFHGRCPGVLGGTRRLLERIVPALHSAGVPFMVAGSFASAAHGLPRSTNDLDIIIDPTRLQSRS